jgi:hypothetical protein
LALGGLSSAFLAGLRLGVLAIEPQAGGGAFRVFTGDRARAVSASGWCWYCRDDARAQLVAEAARPALRRMIDDGDAISRAKNLIEEFADALGVLLVTGDSLRIHAESVVAALEVQVQAMQRSGGMKNINASYREYRLREVAANRKPVGYPTHLHNYKAALLRAAAEHFRIDDLKT